MSTEVFADEGVEIGIGANDEYDIDPRLVRRRCWQRRWVVILTTSILVLTLVAVVIAAFVGTMGKKGGNAVPEDASSVGTTEGGDQAGPPPTSAPTTSPVSVPPPTARPTPTPTSTPTKAPTKNPTMQPTVFQRTDPLAFYVIGDVPYTQSETQVLLNQMQDMRDNVHPGASFLVHVGDFQRAQVTQCAIGYYTNVRNILSQSPAPVLVLSGDNDYLDCPDRDVAWGHFQDHFVSFEQEWTSQTARSGASLGLNDIERSPSRPELFAFEEDSILFIGLNLLHMPEDEDEDQDFFDRIAASKDWAMQQLTQKFASRQIRGVVFFGHATLSDQVREMFVELKAVFSQVGASVPVLYIHGDGHKFNINTNFASNYQWDFFTDLQVDQGAKADPLLIEVAMLKNGVLDPLVAENEMQTVLGNGLFRIDRQKGRYPENDD